MPNLIHLEKTMRGDGYIALVFKKFQMDFRDYLRKCRDPK